MKLLKVRKTFRNGEDYLYKFLDVDALEEEYEWEWEAVRLCEATTGGENYGWECTWEIETNSDEIKRVLIQEINKLIYEKESIELRLTKLHNFNDTLI